MSLIATTLAAQGMVSVLETADGQSGLVAMVGVPGVPGVPGPPGAPGGTISADPGNALSAGLDGGLYCPAVVAGLNHW